MAQLLEIVDNTNKSSKQVLHDFVEKQIETWPLAAANFKGLEKVEEKQFDFDGFQIKVQFNPERIRSSAAKVDKQSIAERKCFLCDENRPPEQMAIGCGEQFQILVNPFPIFKTHFTVTSKTHIDQKFFPNISEMLRIATEMEGFTVFYNGPECGASAPDHLHFQAGENGFLPVETEFESLKMDDSNLLLEFNSTKIWAFDNYLRKMISVETASIIEGAKAIEQIYSQFQLLQPEKIEPMLNVLCYFSKGKWTIHLFPRKMHRPFQFFESGEKQLLISPASVDFGGVFITPRKEDFEKITKADIADIFSQVTVDQHFFDKLKMNIQTA